ncbi:MAG: LysM peptidoglycan-binding domain-containing protein [Candidatus Aureabacteria bacterium]|nr:LysM peptidoglycan-binding domain-containing protein [Candidatus Auribacterota bacterium]
MNRKNLIMAVIGAHVAVLVLAALFGGCAMEKKAVTLSTAGPVKDLRAPEGEPEAIIEPKGMVEETDLLVAKGPESIPAKQQGAVHEPAEEKGLKAGASIERKGALIDARARKEEKMLEAKLEGRGVAVDAAAEATEKRIEGAAGGTKGAARGPIVPEIRRAAAPAAAAGGATVPGTHRVAAGESLWKLSQKYGVPVAELAKANNLKPNASLRVGQILTIPGGAIRAAESSTVAAKERKSEKLGADALRPGGMKKHVVQKGESLSSIAKRYKVSLKKLTETNTIQDPKRIRSGQTLLIP